MYLPFAQGFAMGGGLIIAIGAQNAFVLNQSIKQNHPLLIAGICFTCDVILILIGVSGIGAAIAASPTLSLVATWGGAAFLLFYGARSLLAALKPSILEATGKAELLNRQEAVILTLAVTLLNPHVYLDTVVLLGAISAQFSDALRPQFALGAITASLLWFSALALGGRLLAPFFAKKNTWRYLDASIGLCMVLMAGKLVW